jgi:hypothetical protein
MQLQLKISDALGSFAGIIQFKSDGNEIFYMVVDRVNATIGAVAGAIAQVLDTGTFTVSGGTATLSDSCNSNSYRANRLRRYVRSVVSIKTKARYLSVLFFGRVFY